ncbi:MAG: DUF1492 domain-containing protein [Ruminococcaceae bacterium]|nr:DUF1492 domain-containing protein [Oscillospiraceae bacterium]
MAKTSVKNTEIQKIENYLKGYMLNQKLLRLDRYERTYFGYRDSEESIPDTPLARAKMFEIRHFIMELENSDEKLLLYYHYIRGETVERCAELLGISRSSGFRLKKRALCIALEALNKKCGEDDKKSQSYEAAV